VLRHREKLREVTACPAKKRKGVGNVLDINIFLGGMHRINPFFCIGCNIAHSNHPFGYQIFFRNDYGQLYYTSKPKARRYPKNPLDTGKFEKKRATHCLSRQNML
jgi:hypothetical protein